MDKSSAPNKIHHMMVMLTIVVFIVVGNSAPLFALDPCCTIISVDAKTMTVTARNIKTGLIFTFKVTDKKQLSSLKIGDAVESDPALKTVSLTQSTTRTYVILKPDALTPCCEVVNIQPDGIAPCCDIVTAKTKANGKVFKFRVEGDAVKKALKVGQAVTTISGGWAVVQVSGSSYSFKIL